MENFQNLKNFISTIRTNYDETCVCSKKLNNPHILQPQILNNFKHHELNYIEIHNKSLHQQKNTLNIIKTSIANYIIITNKA